MSKNDKLLEALIDEKLRARQQHRPLRPMDELDWLSYKRQQTKRRLDACRDVLLADYHALTAPTPVPKGRFGFFSALFTHTTTIVEGVRVGFKLYGLVKAFRKS
ncbi:MAG: hypothetical protein KBT12_01890 [Bacteroidales bacterium]|nr:hypothetical protein [Candidatus Physcousia equi]